MATLKRDKWTWRQPTDEKWAGPWVHTTPWEREGILCVAGLKIVVLHGSALSMGSWKAPYTLVAEPSAERKNIKRSQQL